MNCQRILLVEDEPDLRELTAEVIEQDGVTVDACGDATQALASLRDGPRPDLILLDLSLPTMSGADLLAILRADERWRSIPVVAMSGYAESQFPALDADAFLQKPFEIEPMRDLVERLCGTRSAAAVGSR